MGFLSKGSNSATQTQTTSVDPAAYAAYQRLIGQAESTAATPWNPNTSQQIAGFTGDQLAAFNNVRGGIAQPYINQASSFATAGAGPVSQTMQQYYNPWQQSVIDASLRDIDSAASRENSGITGKARMSGSLGGDREAVALELARERQADARNQVITGLNAQGFNQALGAAQNDASRSLTGAGIMGNLGQLAYTDTNALLGIGGQQQQNDQARLDAASANASAQSAYPFQSQQWLAGILGSATPNMGATTTGTKTGPQPNTYSQAIGAAVAAAPYIAAAFADGGAVERASGGGIGYVPQFIPQQGGGMRGPQLSFGSDQQQKSLADHWKDVQSTAKATSDAAGGISKGANELGKWMNSSTTPGGWNTTTDYGSAMGNLSAGIQNIMNLAVGGAVEKKDENDPAWSYDAAPLEPSGGIAAPMPLMDIAKARMVNPQMMPGGQSAPPVMDVDARPQIAGAPAGAGEAYAPPPPGIGQGPLNPNGGVAGWSSSQPIRTETAPVPSQGIGERFSNWIGSEDAKQTLVPMGLAMMAASREGGKGSTGVHFGIGGMEGLKSQAAFRKGEREKEIDQAKLKLAEQAQALRDAEGGRAAAMHPYDIALKQAQTKAVLAGAANKEDPTQAYKIREQQAARLGLDPKSDAFREYVLTGKIGKDEVSATAQKQIIESEESMSNIPATRTLINRALELNKKAYEGIVGKTWAEIDAQLPSSWRSDSAQATRDLNRTMLSQVLAKLKDTFGAAPTEGERKILVDLETASTATAKDRETILNQALAEIEKREKFNQRMLDQLRGKTLFKPQPAAPSTGTSTPDPLGIR